MRCRNWRPHILVRHHRSKNRGVDQGLREGLGRGLSGMRYCHRTLFRCTILNRTLCAGIRFSPFLLPPTELIYIFIIGIPFIPVMWIITFEVKSSSGAKTRLWLRDYIPQHTRRSIANHVGPISIAAKMCCLQFRPSLYQIMGVRTTTDLSHKSLNVLQESL